MYNNVFKDFKCCFENEIYLNNYGVYDNNTNIKFCVLLMKV